MSNQNVAVQVAKEKIDIADEFQVMGVNVKLVSVPVGLVQDAQAHIEPPRVPVFYNEDKAREEENPADPNYLYAVDKYEESKGMAALDTLIMFGIEIDRLPDNDKWLKKVKWMHKRGTLDLSTVDWNEDIDVEFLFKKYVVATTAIIQAVGRKTGISKEQIAQAKKGF